MDCHHFDAGRCRSCSWLELPRTRQLSDLEERVRGLIDSPVWLPTHVGADVGFRTRAKLVVGGTSTHPTLGILDADRAGVDLRDCALHTPGIATALEVMARFIDRADLTPYDVAAGRGELKHVLLTESPDGELMARLVLRSTATEARVRKHLPWLLEALPAVRVVSLNIQPEHKAVIEGEREILLTDDATLPMRLDPDGRPLTLHLRPQSFFQTNTEVARALYAQARAWVDEIAPSSVLDLYCGVGGFALTCAAPGRRVTGVELSGDAVTSARLSAAEAGIDATFVAGDATAYAVESAPDVDLVVVNPPRRGLGAELAGWLERSGAEHVVYSSCDVDSLARDLAAMPSLRPREARVLDMFPHTPHAEIIVRLQRTSSH